MRSLTIAAQAAFVTGLASYAGIPFLGRSALRCFLGVSDDRVCRGGAAMTYTPETHLQHFDVCVQHPENKGEK
jgi:hypothetical protein